MEIADGLRTYLLAQSAISTLVTARIYPLHLPQNPTFPAITYEQNDSEHIEGLSGSNALVKSSIEIHNHGGDDYGDAVELAEAVRLELQGYKGAMGPHTIEGVSMIDSFDHYHPEIDNYTIIQEFEIWHTEVIPTF